MRTHLWYQDLVACRNTHWHPLALLVQRAWADRQHLGLVELFYCAVGKENAARCLGFSFYSLHKHAIEERRKGFDGFESGRLLVFR